MRILIKEDDKKDILDKYRDNIDDKLLIYLRRHYPYYNLDSNVFNGIRILVDEKLYIVVNNKVYLVNKIFNEVEGEFNELEKSTIRRTIKKYLDSIIKVDNT